jgi:predicted transposase YdaD
MQRDSRFYQILQASPPINADSYQFDSVGVKELKLEVDVVFLPPKLRDLAQ